MNTVQILLPLIKLWFSQQRDATQKSNEKVDELEWLKPRQLIKPDDQEDVPEAVRISLFLSLSFRLSVLIIYLNFIAHTRVHYLDLMSLSILYPWTK